MRDRERHRRTRWPHEGRDGGDESTSQGTLTSSHQKPGKNRECSSEVVQAPRYSRPRDTPGSTSLRHQTYHLFIRAWGPTGESTCPFDPGPWRPTEKARGSGWARVRRSITFLQEKGSFGKFLNRKVVNQESGSGWCFGERKDRGRCGDQTQAWGGWRKAGRRGPFSQVWADPGGAEGQSDCHSPAFCPPSRPRCLQAGLQGQDRATGGEAGPALRASAWRPDPGLAGPVGTRVSLTAVEDPRHTDRVGTEIGASRDRRVCVSRFPLDGDLVGTLWQAHL